MNKRMKQSYGTDGDDLEDVIKPYLLNDLTRDILESKPGPCVICKKIVETKYINVRRIEDYVCDHHITPSCKSTWQEQQYKHLRRFEAKQ
jgi:hypothetical protein